MKVKRSGGVEYSLHRSRGVPRGRSRGMKVQRSGGVEYSLYRSTHCKGVEGYLEEGVEAWRCRGVEGYKYM